MRNHMSLKEYAFWVLRRMRVWRDMRPDGFGADIDYCLDNPYVN